MRVMRLARAPSPRESRRLEDTPNHPRRAEPEAPKERGAEDEDQNADGKRPLVVASGFRDDTDRSLHTIRRGTGGQSRSNSGTPAFRHAAHEDGSV